MRLPKTPSIFNRGFAIDLWYATWAALLTVTVVLVVIAYVQA